MLTPFIAISAPGFIPDEKSQITQLFEAGLGRLHLRKRGWNTKQLVKLMKDIPEEFHNRIVSSGAPDLLTECKLAGYHGKLEERESIKLTKDQSFSCSTHGWRETEECIEKVDYLFLSPLFDSISKLGYLANPDLSHFPAHLKGKMIYALGGVTSDNWQDAMDFGYYGVAVLGSLWEQQGSVWKEFDKFKNQGFR